MLGTTNILTTLVLLWTSYHVGVYSMTNSVVEIHCCLEWRFR